MKIKIVLIAFFLFSSCGTATYYKLDKVYFTSTINKHDQFGNKQGLWENKLRKHFKYKNDDDYIILVPFRNNKKIFFYKEWFKTIREKNIIVNHIPNTINPNYINGSITYYKDKNTFNTLYFEIGVLTQLHSQYENCIIDYYPIINFSGKGSFGFKIIKNHKKNSTIYEADQIYDLWHGKKLENNSDIFLELKDYVLSLQPKVLPEF